MSLKALHLIFISLSVILSFGFSYWSLIIAEPVLLIYGVISLIFGIVLILYGSWFLKKLKNISYL